jgi:hypothetical protein
MTRDGTPLARHRAILDAPIAGEGERIDVRVKAGGATQSLSAYLHIVGSSSY